MIGLRVSEKFKDLLEEQAKTENRTLSNFIKNALINYLEQKGIRYVEADDEVVEYRGEPDSRRFKPERELPSHALHEPRQKWGSKKTRK